MARTAEVLVLNSITALDRLEKAAMSRRFHPVRASRARLSVNSPVPTRKTRSGSLSITARTPSRASRKLTKMRSPGRLK
ncbi:MAG: hypothetical protein JRF59_15585 [Deltaproteobacteria bacterium]|nr:hypothetical protein [Deltaproteobacteria bacterium]